MKTIADALAYADTFYKPANKYMSIVMLAAEVRRLREENERLRKDAAVSASIERAAKDLPDGDMLEITVEKDSAMVVLYWGQGGFETMDVDDDNRLAAEINAAIDAARGAKPEPAP